MTTRSAFPPAPSHWMVRVFPLMLGTFAIGSEGLMLAGILPDMARGLHVSLGAAGQLITIFALAYAILGPFLVAITTRFPIRRVLLGSLLVFVLGCVLAALAPSYGAMVVIRVVVAIAAASFRAVATAAGAALAPADQRGRMLALVGSGLTLAAVVSVPLATLITGLTSWRIAFALVAMLGVLAVIGVATLVPELARPPAVTVQMFGRLISRPLFLAFLAITLLSVAGDFVFYAYLAPFTTFLTHGGDDMVALALFLVGLSSVGGIALGGTSSDRFGENRTILVSTLILVVSLLGLWVLCLMAATPATLVLTALALLLWGGAGFGFAIPLQSQLLTAVPDQSVVALALNYSGSLLGMALGGALGGLLVGSQVAWLPLWGAILTVLGFLLHRFTVAHRLPSITASALLSIGAPRAEGEPMEASGR